MSKRQWAEVLSDAEFAELFVGATIVEAGYITGLPYVNADIMWRLSDGRVLAMHVATGGGGCDTCGYGGDEKTYYVLAP